MACVVTSDRPVTLEWFTPENKMVVLTSSTGGAQRYELRNGGRRLEVTRVRKRDLGKYKCVASNQMGEFC